MSTDASTPIEDVLVFQQEQWVDGPPNELFKRLRGECPVHWSPRMEDFPEEAGYWSVTTADGVFEELLFFGQVEIHGRSLLVAVRDRGGAARLCGIASFEARFARTSG